MQISVESTSEISRKMQIQVPEEKVREEIDTRLKSLAKRVKIDGFRPGKIPERVIRQRYGKQVREEVIYDLIRSSFSQALQEQDLRPVGEPQITPQEMAEGKGLEYTAQFEIYPEIKLAALESLEIKKPVCQLSDEDLEQMIQRLREQKKQWHEVDRLAQEGDRVTITFEGLLDGEPIGNGKSEHFEIELGSGNMIPGFEDQLKGAKAGDHLEFELTFPEDYHDEKLAGKNVLFKVEIEKVEEGTLPEVDSDFVKEYGIEDGDIEKFREEVKANMERQVQAALKEQTKNNVLDALFEKNPIPVPEALVKQEIQRTLAPLGDTLKNNPEILNQLPLDQIQEKAKKRVALGLLLSEVIRTNELKPDPEKIRSAIEALAENYEDPEEVIQYYSSNPEARAQIENSVLEDQAIEWILERAKVTEEPISFEELVKERQSS
ncbi:MAG: trigger factor [Methylothermaceae bacteria B42]|nr:MAG: trigger factor [Methylothermaceae bacteria B42]HHJ39954.1 trigger factor [Methylothermaceae bacterium]